MTFPDKPVVLEGAHVRLEPLTREHVAPLTGIGLDADLWQWTMTQVHSPADMTAYVEAALAELEAGQSLPYATVERRSGRVVGSTRFGSLDRRNRRVEIGWTSVARRGSARP